MNDSQSSNERLTPEKLAEYHDLLPLGRFVGVGGDALKSLLDEIEACWAERKPPVETTTVNPFYHAAIMGNPGNRRISMSFEKQEQYEAAIAFLDMDDSPEEPKADYCEKHGVHRAFSGGCPGCYHEKHDLPRAPLKASEPTTCLGLVRDGICSCGQHSPKPRDCVHTLHVDYCPECQRHLKQLRQVNGSEEQI